MSDLATDPFTALILAVVAAIWLAAAAVAAPCAIAASVLRRRRAASDMEALIEATREGIPDHVPDTWVEEFRR